MTLPQPEGARRSDRRTSRKLDEVGLLWGPTSSDLEDALRTRMHETGFLPLRQSRILGATADEARSTLEGWMTEAEDPELDFDVAGLFVPRIDYPQRKRSMPELMRPLQVHPLIGCC